MRPRGGQAVKKATFRSDDSDNWIRTSAAKRFSASVPMPLVALIAPRNNPTEMGATPHASSAGEERVSSGALAIKAPTIRCERVGTRSLESSVCAHTALVKSARGGGGWACGRRHTGSMRTHTWATHGAACGMAHRGMTSTPLSSTSLPSTT
eukprot:6915123-Prymnesium_polylepis.2